MNITREKILLFGFVVVMLVGIPTTLYTIKNQQDTRTQAEKSTTLSFLPESTDANPIKKAAGEEFALSVQVDPGTNIVSFVKLDIQYDETKLATSEAEEAFKVNQAAFPVVLEGPVVQPGKIAVTLSVGSDPTSAIQQVTNAVTIKFKTLAETGGVPTNVTFGNNTEILSIGGSDQASENVLLNVNPAVIVIGDTGGTPGGGTPTTAPTDIPVPTDAPAPTAPAPTDSGPVPTAGPTAINQAPVCSALNIDRASTGDAPYPVTFTAVGNDADGTISNVVFNYGDGPVDSVTETGGIGSNAVSVQRAHTYTNPGTYQASATLTDNMQGVSDINSCKTTIIVLAPTSGVGGPIDGTITPSTTMADPGPGDAFIGIGIAAALFMVIGGLLFFAL